MGALLQDIEFSIRSLRKSPGFTCVVILTLGLGIGFNTAIYSVIKAFILRPLPVKDPEQLVILATRDKHTDVPRGLFYPDYRDYRGLTAVFSDVFGRREFPYAANWKRDHQTERIWIDAVTTNYFDLLGVNASRGWTFLARGDEAVGCGARLCVLAREIRGGSRHPGPGDQFRRPPSNGDRYRPRGLSRHAGLDAPRYLRPAASTRTRWRSPPVKATWSESGPLRAAGRS